MARTAYCKRCGKEVEAGEMCPFCGTRLGKNAVHAAWCVERTPVKDWMYWNSVMRLLLPGVLAILILVLLLEGISGGPGAVEKMIASAFLPVLGILLLTTLGAVFAILLLQGKELSDFVVDSRGIHETRYLPDPTPLKLILRMKTPKLPPEEGESRILKLSERRIAWKDTMDYIREKLGRRKKVRLPRTLIVQAPAAGRRAVRNAPVYHEPETQQIRMEEEDLRGTLPDEETTDAENTEPLT